MLLLPPLSPVLPQPLFLVLLPPLFVVLPPLQLLLDVAAVVRLVL